MIEAGLSEVDHLAWVKTRAMVYADQGDRVNCVASLQTDLVRHPALRDHHAIAEADELVAQGRLRTKAELRAFVESL